MRQLGMLLTGLTVLALVVAGLGLQSVEASPTNCDPNDHRGAVSLTMEGHRNDSFRVSMVCAGEVVAECTATVGIDDITPGEVIGTASCHDGPNPIPNESENGRCQLSPANGNSDVAKARTWGCG